jgi:sugar phosphate isomerase/epimerase
MDLSVTTDYETSTGCPGPYLERIARAGFTHVHWCHQWNTDFLYSRWEIDQIAAWLGACGLKLLDLHASAGREKGWYSDVEYERRSGVELVTNRLEMTARLGGEVAILHVPDEPAEPAARAGYLAPVQRSLDELEPVVRRCGVRLAIENGDFRTIEQLLAAYPPDYLGLCYDCGHGNIAGDGLDQLEANQGRLISVHLHDNDGQGDQHRLPFTGTVDWPRLAGLLATSAYQKCVSLEVVRGNTGIEREEDFLAQAWTDGSRLTRMIAGHRPAG